MLPERYRELLTAYVDGELSSRQRRTLQKLLRRSPEARKLLKQMQADSNELRALPPARLEQDLSDSVLTLIAQRQIQPPRARLVTPPMPPLVAGALWPHLAAAAAILLAVGIASYLFFASSFDLTKPSGPVAKEEHKPTPPKDDEQKAVEPPKEIVDKTPPKKADDKETPKPMDEPKPSAIVKDKPKPGSETKLPPPVDDAFTAPNMELFELKKAADIALPVVVKLHQLEQEAKRKGLLDELKKTSSFRLELPCSNGSKVFDRLQAACKADNISLVIEPNAQDRLRKPLLKTNYVVFLEDITPEELTRWLIRVAAEDRKAETKKQPEPQLEALVLTQMSKQDREQWSKLLGIEPSKMGTGQGGAPRPDDGKPTAKAVDQTALVLAYNPVRPNPKAPEVERWLKNRKRARPGTLQILLVLRSMNG